MHLVTSKLSGGYPVSVSVGPKVCNKNIKNKLFRVNKTIFLESRRFSFTSKGESMPG